LREGVNINPSWHDRAEYLGLAAPLPVAAWSCRNFARQAFTSKGGVAIGSKMTLFRTLLIRTSSPSKRNSFGKRTT
jgi:hypothetical protein